MKCHQLARKQADEAQLKGRLRTLVQVFASGYVERVTLPHWNRRNADYDSAAAGGPIPNPSNAHLSQVVVPCLKTSLPQTRFAPTAEPWGFTIDFQIGR